MKGRKRINSMNIVIVIQDFARIMFVETLNTTVHACFMMYLFPY